MEQTDLRNQCEFAMYDSKALEAKDFSVLDILDLASLSTLERNIRRSCIVHSDSN